MYRVLITGGFGIVGVSAVKACLEAGDDVAVLEADSPANRRRGRALGRRWSSSGLPVRILYGDIRDPRAAREAVKGRDAVIHLAAIIPPAADRLPDLARSVNIEGTASLLAACAEQPQPPRFVYASSVAVYGDRLSDYWISVGDRLEPSPEDEYGRTKVVAESLVRSSGLGFSILRLSAIMSRMKLDPDPLLFSMPLSTKLEICHTEDAGRAFVRAAKRDAALGMTFNIGGGASCRCEYRDFLDRMLILLGIGGVGGRAGIPDAAFARAGFHCGWYADSDQAEKALAFRSKSLADYYAEVQRQTRWLRPFARIAAPFVRARLRAASPYLTVKDVASGGLAAASGAALRALRPARASGAARSG